MLTFILKSLIKFWFEFLSGKFEYNSDTIDIKYRNTIFSHLNLRLSSYSEESSLIKSDYIFLIG
jgi:hypothetical protein